MNFSMYFLISYYFDSIVMYQYQFFNFSCVLSSSWLSLASPSPQPFKPGRDEIHHHVTHCGGQRHPTRQPHQ